MCVLSVMSISEFQSVRCSWTFWNEGIVLYLYYPVWNLLVRWECGALELWQVWLEVDPELDENSGSQSVVSCLHLFLASPGTLLEMHAPGDPGRPAESGTLGMGLCVNNPFWGFSCVLKRTSERMELRVKKPGFWVLDLSLYTSYRSKWII